MWRGNKIYMKNKTPQKKQPKQLRTARLSVSVAIQDALEVGKILKKFVEIFGVYDEKKRTEIKNRKVVNEEITINLSGYELTRINGALRDYLTLRIANIFDSRPACKSLKDYPDIDLNKIKKIPEIKKILHARDNWIGHINKRFIGPVDKKVLYGKKVIDLLRQIEILVCTETIKEKNN